MSVIKIFETGRSSYSTRLYIAMDSKRLPRSFGDGSCLRKSIIYLNGLFARDNFAQGAQSESKRRERRAAEFFGGMDFSRAATAQGSTQSATAKPTTASNRDSLPRSVMWAW